MQFITLLCVTEAANIGQICTSVVTNPFHPTYGKQLPEALQVF